MESHFADFFTWVAPSLSNKEWALHLGILVWSVFLLLTANKLFGYLDPDGDRV